MNGLSWLLYAADVSEGARLVALLLMITCAVVTIGSVVIWVAVMDDDPGEKQRADVTRWMGHVWWRFLPVAMVCLVVFVIVPQRQTMMLIAASEVGETVLASDQAQAIGGEAGELATDSLRVLRKFINDQLDVPASEEAP